MKHRRWYERNSIHLLQHYTNDDMLKERLTFTMFTHTNHSQISRIQCSSSIECYDHSSSHSPNSVKCSLRSCCSRNVARMYFILFLFTLTVPCLSLFASAAHSSPSTSGTSNKHLVSDLSSSLKVGSSLVTSDEHRSHTVSAFVGGEVSLPCAVDVAGCGRIYFITWTKNGTAIGASDIQSTFAKSTSGSAAGMRGTNNAGGISKSNSADWQRVFIFSETYEKVLGDLEKNGPKGRVVFGPRDRLNHTQFVFLTVRSVSAEDEGLYKCDVTYTTPHAHGKCPSLTYTRVQTLVKPSAPRLRVNDKSLSEYHLESSTSAETDTDYELLRNRQIGPFEEGSTIVFECSTSGGRPAPELRWYNGSRPLRTKISVVKSGTPIESIINDFTLSKSDNDALVSEDVVVATTRIVASRHDLGAKFECRVLWNNTGVSWTTSATSDIRDGHRRPSDMFSSRPTLNASHDWVLLDIKVRPLTIKVDPPRSGPVVIGETVMLRCTVEGARPAANITWYNRSEAVIAEELPPAPPPGAMKLGVPLSSGGPPRTRFTSQLMTDGTYRSTSILVFAASRADHLADFFCKGSNEILRNRNEVPLLQGVQLSVQYPPIVAVEPEGLIAVNETSSVQLWCTFDANPPNITEVVWFKNGSPIDFDVFSPEKLWNTRDERGTPILTISDIDRTDSAEYRCRIRNTYGASDSVTIARLEVAYPPLVRIEVVEPSNRVVHENVNSILSLRCDTVQGNPRQLTMVQWYCNGRHFLTTISPRINQKSSSHLYRQIGSGRHFELIDGQPETLGGLLNEATIDFVRFHEPLIHYSETPEIVNFKNVTRTFAGNYSCTGFNGAANSSEQSSPITIQVDYKPGKPELSLNGKNEDFVLHGEQALIECRVSDSGFPRAHSIIWSHNEVRLADQSVATDVNYDLPDMPLVSRYKTLPASLSTSGKYGCSAVNELGEGPVTNFNLDVKSPPKLIQGLPSSIGSIEGENLTLICRVECEPLCEVNWHHNNLTLLSPSGRGVFSSTVRNQLRVKLRTGTELTFWLENMEHKPVISDGLGHTESRLHIVNTSVLFDYDQISCASAEPWIGFPVSSTVIFRREFAPKSVQMSLPQIDLLEGETYPHKPVQCSAYGNPSPNYYWTFSPFLLNEQNSVMNSRNNPDSSVKAYEQQNIITIGNLLTLNLSTMIASNAALKSELAVNARIAQEQVKFDNNLNNFLSSGSSTGSHFRASRLQAGNYTCVATNKHGIAYSTMTVNVFYRPECQLHPMDSDKVLRQQFNQQIQPGMPTLVTEKSASTHLLIKCTGTSNPPPTGFAWYRRNGSELVQIQPSQETDYKLLVALEDEFGLIEPKSNSHDGFLSDQQHTPQKSSVHHATFHFGHWRESAVLRVPNFARLEEYACVVTNHIGSSQPCWFDSAKNDADPSIGENSNWRPFGGINTSNANNNLMVALTAIGLIVLIILIIIGTVLFFCWHRNRQSSFKGFVVGSSSLNSKTTPNRFKHDRSIQESLPVHLLDSSNDMDMGFLDARNATLTAGYRMTGANGTISNNFRTIQHLSRGTQSSKQQGSTILPNSSSIYGENSSQNSSQNGSRPFLVSYASSNVYAEPDYIANCGAGGSSNHSGDQMTGSTNVTCASSRMRQTEDNYPTYEELDTARSAIRQIKCDKHRRRKNGQQNSDDSAESECEDRSSVPLAPYLSSVQPSTSDQDAYNPERDFYLPQHSSSNQFELSYGTRKRTLPTKYGSLMRQSTVPASPLRALQQGNIQPAQFQASPMSTRIYFNFNEAPNNTNDAPGYGLAGYNSLARYGPTGGRTRLQRTEPQNMVGSFEAQHHTQTPQQHSFETTPPDYHRIFQN